jgi:small-conductance mechanosensitive channel/competence protein ComGC
MLKKNHKLKNFTLSKIIIFLVIISLTLLINITVFAQSNLSTSKLTGTIVIDGRELFKVAPSQTISAQIRAEGINYQLQEIIKSEQNPRLEIKENNNSPIIYINNRYLLTVTQEDTLPGITPQQQANIWGQRLTDTIQKAQQERLQSYIIRSLIWGIILLVWTICIHWFLGKIWQNIHLFFKHIFQLEDQENSSSESEILKSVLKITLTIARISIWIIVILYIANIFPLTRVWGYRLVQSLINGFTTPFIPIGNNSYSLLNFLILICLLIGAFLGANTLANILRLRVLNLTQISREVQEAIAIFVKYTLIFIASIVILQVWGFNLSSLTILASGISVAIGFGFQNIAKNFGSGLVLLFERPIKVGDFVEVNQYMGIVEHIGPRSTIIRTLDQISIIVPNSRFLEEEVINWSHSNSISRVRLPLGVSYNCDVNLVKTILLQVAQESTDVLKEPPPLVLFKGFGDHAINFELLVWIEDPSKQGIVKSDLFFALESSLKQHNIEIPFPQQDLHFRSGNIPIQLSIMNNE